MARYCQNNFDNDESYDLDDFDEQHEKNIKKKSKKVDFDTIEQWIYYQNYFNEGHFKKECKILMNL